MAKTEIDAETLAKLGKMTANANLVAELFHERAIDLKDGLDAMALCLASRGKDAGIPLQNIAAAFVHQLAAAYVAVDERGSPLQSAPIFKEKARVH